MSGHSNSGFDISLTRREREMMNVLYKLGRASAQEIRKGLIDAPSYSTVRTILRILETKGLVRHFEEHLRYIYEPTTPGDIAYRHALENLIQTFFKGSLHQTILALLNHEPSQLTRCELDEISEKITEMSAAD